MRHTDTAMTDADNAELLRLCGNSPSVAAWMLDHQFCGGCWRAATMEQKQQAAREFLAAALAGKAQLREVVVKSDL